MSAVSSGGPYRAGLYLRLSKDDEGSGESSSITTQRSILTGYAESRGLDIIDEYADEGYSGTTYERPGFKRMLSDIERGRINCVLTKDLSRLGRNSARTGDLLDEYFPGRGVRYISVNDGYDSNCLTGGAAIAVPFLAVMHEMYARDISAKIRSSFKSKMEKGQFIGSFSPYGYKQDRENGTKTPLSRTHRPPVL
ncbi:MAG: recombinase family protein [Oscillospiraceae bacterium]|nr:recombinase family protein [Oscillospiraceae bacterium]